MSKPSSPPGPVPAARSESAPPAASHGGSVFGGEPAAGTGPRVPVLEGSISRRILELAWPAIIGNLLHSTVGLIDIKIVGSLGPSAVAAVGTGHRIFWVLQAVLMAITTGTTAMVARSWGAGEREEAALITRASFFLCAGVATLLAIPGWLFGEQVIHALFTLDPEALELGGVFLRWMVPFNASFGVFLVLGVALRAAGDTRTPLWIGLVTNVVNVFLLYGLVFGEFGMPEMGVAGAALANGLAFTSGAVIITVLWLRRRLVIGPGRGRALAGWRMRELLRIGYPAALEQGVWQGGFIAFMVLLSWYGTAPYAAYQIGVNILSFSFVIGFGFSIAASTLVGQNLGAGDTEAAARSGWRGMRLAMISMAIMGAAIIAGAEPIARWMLDDEEVVRLTVIFIWILGVVQPLMAAEFSIGGALRGAGDTRTPLFSTLAGLIGVRVLSAAIFYQLDFSVEWIYAALIGDYMIKAAILIGRFAQGRWKTIDFASASREGMT